jgi:adenosylcobinamide-GDP ribazoletransferase
MYSKLPVPQLEWKEKEMRYTIIFFPVIGLVIGAVIIFWEKICDIRDGNLLLRTVIAVLIPLIVTGGIHLDGFMDTSDALHSYQPKEKKLEILKDSHIGAFSVIMLIGFLGFYLAAASELTGKAVVIWGMSFFLSRTLSGLSVVSFPNAKKEGTLFTFSSAAHKKTVRIVLIIELICCCTAMILVQAVYGIASIAAAGLVFTYYYSRSKREFGGITGDVAGWFLCLCELAMPAVMALLILMGR